MKELLACVLLAVTVMGSSVQAEITEAQQDMSCDLGAAILETVIKHRYKGVSAEQARIVLLAHINNKDSALEFISMANNSMAIYLSATEAAESYRKHCVK